MNALIMPTLKAAIAEIDCLGTKVNSCQAWDKP